MTEGWSLKGVNQSEEQRDAPLRTAGGMFFLKHVITTACPIVLAERQVKLLSPLFRTETLHVLWSSITASHLAAEICFSLTGRQRTRLASKD